MFVAIADLDQRSAGLAAQRAIDGQNGQDIVTCPFLFSTLAGAWRGPIPRLILFRRLAILPIVHPLKVQSQAFVGCHAQTNCQVDFQCFLTFDDSYSAAIVGELLVGIVYMLPKVGVPIVP